MIRAVLALTFLMCSCSGASSSSSNVSGGKMLHAEDPMRISDYWSEWTPTADHQTPDHLSTSRAFDYWAITEEKAKEQHWAALFSVLDFFRSDVRIDPQQRLSIESLMAALENKGAEMDATFVVSNKEKAWEGVVMRYAYFNEGSHASISTFLQRDAGSGQEMSRLWIWLQPGYLEAPTMTIFIDREPEGWRSAIAPGLVVAATVDENDVAPIAMVFGSAFWSTFTATNYVESSPNSKAPLQSLSPGLGMKVVDRDIDQVFSDTVFPPRLTFPIQ